MQAYIKEKRVKNKALLKENLMVMNLAVLGKKNRENIMSQLRKAEMAKLLLS